jgi:hypothetical protein
MKVLHISILCLIKQLLMNLKWECNFIYFVTCSTIALINGGGTALPI